MMNQSIKSKLMNILYIENASNEAYKTLDILSTLDFGSEILKKYVDIFKEKLTFMNTQMLERKQCVRLLARLSHCD